MSLIPAYGFPVEDKYLDEVYDLLYFCANLESEEELDPAETEEHFRVRQTYRREDSLVEVYFKDKKKHTLGAIEICYFLTEAQGKFVEDNPGVTPDFILAKFNEMIGLEL